MRLKSSQLNKSFGTVTVPATETKSIGLQADAQLSWFLQTPPRQFYHDMTNPATETILSFAGICKNCAMAACPPGQLSG